MSYFDRLVARIVPPSETTLEQGIQERHWTVYWVHINPWDPDEVHSILVQATCLDQGVGVDVDYIVQHIDQVKSHITLHLDADGNASILEHPDRTPVTAIPKIRRQKLLLYVLRGCKELRSCPSLPQDLLDLLNEPWIETVATALVLYHDIAPVDWAFMSDAYSYTLFQLLPKYGHEIVDEST